MLIRLEIKDLAVISHAVFEPREGLNVISGETGAGKSLLIDAIGLILGSKSSRNIIRTGAGSTFVEAVFDISSDNDEELSKILSDSGITSEDGLLIISRTVSKDGKSIARVNGRTVVLAVLRSIASCLVDIHGQHDTQKIFDQSVHVDLLDSFGGEDVRKCFDDYYQKLNEYKESVLKIRNLQASGVSSGKRKEYLEFAVKEISDASLKEGEEEKLKERKKVLSDLEKSINGLTEADSLLNGDENMSVVDRLGRASKDISSLSNVDPSYKDLSSRLESLYLEVQSACEEIRDLAEKNPFDPEESSRIDKRLGLIYELQAKYGPSTADVLKFYEDSVEELDSLKDINKKISELKKERSQKESLVLEAATKLSGIRKAKADLLCK
ncbi:MAG: AAA family ATPase, partial [Clostridiales bacterium]|nr:AAA family ATPase [Clostridiales bacterium]